MLRCIWHWLNSTFGRRQHFRGKDGKVYVKEGFNIPEELFKHLKEHHPNEHANLGGKGNGNNSN